MRKKTSETCKSEAGMTLIEVMIASVIFSFVLLSFGYMMVMGQGLVGSGGDRRVAAQFANESLEVIKSRGYTWLEGDLTNGASPYGWTLNGSNVYEGSDATGVNYHDRDVDVAYVNDSDMETVVAPGSSQTLKITVTVSPVSTSGREIQYKPVVYSTHLTNPVTS